jgi:SAM-dependent methyltransferase
MRDPTERFSGRVEPYERYRPGYPREVVDVLAEHCGLSDRDVVADIGSGTGKLSRLFLDHGNRVFGVEPNAEMRRAAERLFADRPRFVSVAGRAEETSLEEGSVDLVAAAQAFHWFNAEPARREFARILRPGGHLAVIWNARRLADSKFMREYETLLSDHGAEYGLVGPHSLDEAARLSLFGRDQGRLVVLDHYQSLTYEGLEGRVVSASYMPARDQRGYAEMIRALRALFETHQSDGRVRLEYDTRVYCGPLRADTP